MGFDDKTSNKVDDLGGKAKEGLGKVTETRSSSPRARPTRPSPR